MEHKNKFSKKEKLKSKKAIDLLFSEGESINAFPIRAIYIKKVASNKIPIIIGVAVPKKNIKLAVNRNLLKRRMREAYRLNNQYLKKHLRETGIELNVMLIYTSKQILSYNEIEEKIKVILTCLNRLSEVVDK